MTAHLTLSFLGPLQPLAPALVVSGYFIVMLGVFALKSRLVGLPVDADVARRSASKLLGRYLRHYLMWLLRPYERALIRLRISPNAITMTSLVTAGLAGWALATGRFALGGWLFLFTGILDIFDGRVARATGQVSAGGAFFDSVMDRYSELLVFGGLAYFYRSSWAMLIVLAAAVGSVMVSYTRARAEGLGIHDVNIGTMQRPERLVYLGVTTALAPILETLVGHGSWPMFVPVVVALALLALSANVTAV
ncbi:MAG TPA: CDP-alcohol phosphatidyltransferase family protein, partial [Polyangia bacterium]